MSEETTAPFSSREALALGWARTRDHLKPFLILGGIGIFLALLNQGLSVPPGEEGDGLRGLLRLAVQVLQVALGLIYVRAALGVVDGRGVDLSRPRELLTDFFSYLLTAILYALVVTVGLALLIVPGVIWAVMFAFAGFLVVDKRVDPIAALKGSAHVTRGARWHVLGFGLLVFAVNLLGALALGVGLLVTVPTTAIAAAHVLRRLQVRAATRAPAAQQPAGPAVPLTTGPR